MDYKTLIRIAIINVPKSKDRVHFVVQGSVAEKDGQIKVMVVTDHLEVTGSTPVLLKVHYFNF